MTIFIGGILLPRRELGNLILRGVSRLTTMEIKKKPGITGLQLNRPSVDDKSGIDGLVVGQATLATHSKARERSKRGETCAGE